MQIAGDVTCYNVTTNHFRKSGNGYLLFANFPFNQVTNSTIICHFNCIF